MEQAQKIDFRYEINLRVIETPDLVKILRILPKGWVSDGHPLGAYLQVTGSKSKAKEFSLKPPGAVWAALQQCWYVCMYVSM